MAGRGRLGFWWRLALVVLEPPMTALTRREWSGQEHVPRRGPVIVAVNHISYADPLTVAHFLLDVPRRPHFLAKVQLFALPFLGRVLRGTGQIPVRRGTSDAAQALSAAVDALARGQCVVIYPEATITKRPDRWPKEARTGVARLALATGAPVVPVAQWGVQDLLGLDGRPHPFPRTRVQVRAGRPVDLSAWRGHEPDKPVLDAVTDAVMAAVTAELALLRGEQPPDR